MTVLPMARLELRVRRMPARLREAVLGAGDIAALVDEGPHQRIPLLLLLPPVSPAAASPLRAARFRLSPLQRGEFRLRFFGRCLKLRLQVSHCVPRARGSFLGRLGSLLRLVPGGGGGLQGGDGHARNARAPCRALGEPGASRWVESSSAQFETV